MRPVPIKWRIAIGVTALLLVAIVVISIVAYNDLKESLNRHLDETLRGLAADVESDLTSGEETEAVETGLHSTLGTGERPQSTQYRIWREGAREEVLGRSQPDAEALWRQALTLHEEPRPDKMVFYNLRQSGGAYRAVWSRRQTDAGITNTFIAISTYKARLEMQEFFRFLMILGGCIAVGCGIATGLVVFWAFRPIGAMGDRLTMITDKTLGGEHLYGLKVPSELAPFRDALRGMLERLDQAMRQQKRFTADASHELRTPLALAKSTLQAAQIKGASTEGYQQAIAETLEDIGRMERLMDQLLTLARMDEAPESFQSQEVSLDEVLAGVAIAYGPRVTEHGGRVDCDPMPDTRIHGNKVQLEQLFGNLLDNAFRHGPSGGTVRIQLATEGNGWCVATVHDDGGGISPEDIPRLFDRFCRADASRARATGGTGLGLSIVQEIVRRHGGRVEIVSNPDEGTNVRVHLPGC